MNPNGQRVVIQPQMMHSVVSAPQVGPNSTHMVCISCGADIYSKTSKKANSCAWWSCILMCLFGCFCGCCLIPCCMDSCNVVNHTCPNCDAFLGQYRP